jgi:uncharacterized protein
MPIVSRDSFPDVLRGFALFGIAMVNIQFFSISTFDGAESLDLSEPESASVAFIVFALFQAKFYLVFSFLFGYSAHYVLKDHKINRRRWIARAIGLVLLGLIHLTFFFHGDILFIYGVFALLLTLLYFRTEKTLKVWAWVIYIITAVLFVVIAAFVYLGELIFASKGKTLPGLGTIDSLDVALSSGGFFEIAVTRFEFWLMAAGPAFVLQGSLVFVAFIVGVLVARKDGLGASLKPELMKKFALWGLTLGLALQLLAGYIFIANEQAEGYSLTLYLVATALNFLTAPLMSAGLVGGIWLLSQRWRLSLLSAAGRHSLSIYLGQSLVFSTLFSAWGFGLFQELSLLTVVLIAAGTWLTLALLAQLNLRYRNRGPMEALLTNFSKLLEAKS